MAAATTAALADATSSAPPGPRARDAVPITSVQPGGGFCVGLEARWGRARRAWLRRVRPGYVRRMTAARVGACAGCTHDVIDGRDLKLVRNVCGVRFRPEDDRFRWRDRVGLARAGLAEVIVTTAGCAIATAVIAVAAHLADHWGPWLGMAAVAAVWLQGLYFFRDPTRAIPADPRALLAPCDGVVTHLHEVDDDDFPGGRALRISVYLSPWDVHLNRIPRPGRIVAVRYLPGAFLNARHRECAVRNEQLWIDLVEPDGRLVRVKQISGAMARRLVCWLRVGEDVEPGARYGMIKYGSRADVLVPPGDDIELAVAIGDRVSAGSTVMLRRSPAPGTAA